MSKKRPSLKSLKNRAWKVVSEYVRRRDADEGGTVACYTCGELYFWKELHAGHAIPGRRNAVLFDVDIIKPQCPRDNLWMGGRHEIFAAKLIREHGLEWFEEKLIGARQAVKLTRDDLEKIIETYKQKLKEMELETVNA